MELQYLDELKSILLEKDRKTRNSVTKSKFGSVIECKDINSNFPLMTTKRIFWKGVVEELLWFLKGQTNSLLLQSKGVNIWQPNSDREFLDKLGFNNRKVGDCGPIYGFQWRHYGAKYVDCESLYEGQGIDQLKNCIKTILQDPHSRRIIMTGYNLEQINEMVLPPCHVSYQFYVSEGKLNCFLYQRSGDMFLGIPFNIASTALLITIIAHYTGLIPGTVRLNICDAHIYSEHIEAVNTQLDRIPGDLPIVKINDNISGVITDNIEESVNNILKRIESLTFDKIELIGYKHQGMIKAAMIA